MSQHEPNYPEHDSDDELRDEHLPAVVPVGVATPAQSKAAAVNTLLAKAVDKASELRLTPEESAALKAEFPDEAFRAGAAGKDDLIYIEHLHLRNRLDEVLGIGQAVLVPRSRWTEEFEYHKDGQVRKGIKVYVEAMLIVRGCYITEAVGEMTYYPGNQGADYSDAVEGAETAALRRCAKKFGIGLQAWSKTWCEGWWSRRGGKPAGGGSNGDAPSGGGYSKAPNCPKCGKMGRVSKEGNGYYCWKKKDGCGHTWSDAPAEPEKPNTEANALIDEWEKKLNPHDVNLTKLNTTIIADFKAIPGQASGRSRIWSMIVDFAESFNCYFNHGEKQFVERQ